MLLNFEDRSSDSPFVERVWRSRSERAGPFLSVASPHLEMVVTHLAGRSTLTIRGPETRATVAECPPDGAWVAIRFRLGTYMPGLPTCLLMDRRDVHIPVSAEGAFQLAGVRCEVPTFENAESFVARLARCGVIARDPAVEAALQGEAQAITARSVQRRFLRATGMTHGAFRQIARARYAAGLLQGGVSILDAVHEAGYFDQAHLTRAMRGLIGQTPARIARREDQLSFLYKTTPDAWS